ERLGLHLVLERRQLEREPELVRARLRRLGRGTPGIGMRFRPTGRLAAAGLLVGLRSAGASVVVLAGFPVAVALVAVPLVGFPLAAVALVGFPLVAVPLVDLPLVGLALVGLALVGLALVWMRLVALGARLVALGARLVGVQPRRGLGARGIRLAVCLGL